MKVISFPIEKNICLLALGAESVGVFAIYKNGKIFISQNFGDILLAENFQKFKKKVLVCFKKIKPDVVLTDLHPLYNSAILGQELSKRYKIPQVKIQHHLAHVFSAVGDRLCHPELVSGSGNHRFRNKFGMTNNCEVPNTFYGIAADGTGYGLDGNIWGGEVFKIKNQKSSFDKLRMTLSKAYGEYVESVEVSKIKNDVMRHPEVCLLADRRIPWNIQRVGSLEEQIMIGGDLAVKEPARMLIAIMAKIKNQKPVLSPSMEFILNEVEGLRINSVEGSNIKNLSRARRGMTNQNSHLRQGFGGQAKIIKSKNDIYYYVRKFYTRNEFELLYNQLEQDFNCQKTTSTGRILDAVAVLLGFSGNQRKYKHEAAKLLEKNSTKPYGIDPIISSPKSPFEKGGQRGILQTTPLFEYLIKNIHKDKKRLAATAQEYIAKGLCEIIKKTLNTKYQILNTYFAGGMANNKIISSYLENRGVYVSKKIPRGDEGIAVGQIVYYLLSNAL